MTQNSITLAASTFSLDRYMLLFLNTKEDAAQSISWWYKRYEGVRNKICSYSICGTGVGGAAIFKLSQHWKKCKNTFFRQGLGRGMWGEGRVAVSGYFYIFSWTSKMSPILAKVPISKLGCSIGIRWWLHVNSWSQEPPLWGGYLLWDKCYMLRFSYSAGVEWSKHHQLSAFVKLYIGHKYIAKLSRTIGTFWQTWEGGEGGGGGSYFLVISQRPIMSIFYFAHLHPGTFYAVRINCARLYSFWISYLCNHFIYPTFWFFWPYELGCVCWGEGIGRKECVFLVYFWAFFGISTKIGVSTLSVFFAILKKRLFLL